VLGDRARLGTIGAVARRLVLPARPSARRAPATRGAVVGVPDRPGAPSAARGPAGVHGPSARAGAGALALLAHIEQIRPGLARHRGLDLDCRSGALAHALCESFDEFVGLVTRFETLRAAKRANRHGERCRFRHFDPKEPLRFDDETFDLVCCGRLLRGRNTIEAEHLIGEAMRVLRLQGVGVIDADGGDMQHDESLRLPGADRPLEVRFAVSEQLTCAPGEPGRLDVTVTNAGARTLGSAVDPLVLASHWNDQRGIDDTSRLEISGILPPGDSLIATVELTLPRTPGLHALELWLSRHGPLGEQRSNVTTIHVTFTADDLNDRRAARAIAASIADELVTGVVSRAGGVLLGHRRIEPDSASGTRWRYLFARA
jgi:SAM-dependent methyltransferase